MNDLVYRYVPGRSAETLLLLHGTGGDENDLLAIGEAVLPGAALLSPRGPVLENGMPRFFRRFAEGVFDEQDIIHRAAELAQFIRRKAKEHGFDPDRLIALGYSNGANIAAAMLLTGAAKFPRSVLIRAMVPLRPPTLPDLSGTEVFLATGRYDPIATAAETRQLTELLTEGGAIVSAHQEESGHPMTRGDIEAVGRWLAQQ